MLKVSETVKLTFSHVPSKGVNPDEAVASHAIQNGLLTGNVTDILLLDATPLSLTKKLQVFSTAADGQTAIEVKIFQGECKLVRNNKLLSNFNLIGILPPRVSLRSGLLLVLMLANGIVHINAKDKATGKDQLMTIASSPGLSDKNIEHMVVDAEKYADADKAHQELIEEANKGESVCVDTNKKAMNELKDQLGAAKKVSKLIGELCELALKGLKVKPPEVHCLCSPLHEAPPFGHIHHTSLTSDTHLYPLPLEASSSGSKGETLKLYCLYSPPHKAPPLSHVHHTGGNTSPPGGFIPGIKGEASKVYCFCSPPHETPPLGHIFCTDLAGSTSPPGGLILGIKGGASKVCHFCSPPHETPPLGHICCTGLAAKTKGSVPTHPAIKDKNVHKGSILAGNNSIFCTLKGIHLIEISSNKCL
ncbi:Hsp70 protein-domain-containing protein [Pisolithus croceorrhizus]|nr:Hsp70 protein-domain-containing protein [Pisolithus croceorrhizus]